MPETAPSDSLAALNKLCKWRSILAGWIAGSRGINTPGQAGLRDLIDRTLVCRVESNALGRLLIDKGLCSASEWHEAVREEAEQLDRAFEASFPGMRSSATGMVLEPVAVAAETMRVRGFPP